MEQTNDGQAKKIYELLEEVVGPRPTDEDDSLYNEDFDVIFDKVSKWSSTNFVTVNENPGVDSTAFHVSNTLNSDQSVTLTTASNTNTGLFPNGASGATTNTGIVSRSENGNIGNFPNNTTNVQMGDYPNNTTSGTGVGGTLSPNHYYYQPYTYPYTWITYNTTDTNFGKILVTKAENGFVLVYNGKTYIAKNETEVAKVIVKVTKPEDTAKAKK